MACRGLSPASCLAAIAALWSPGCLSLETDAGAPDDPEQIGSGREEIVRGEPTTDLPSAGMLLVGGTADVGFIVCSATLIDCDKVLTAAHCVCQGFGAACHNTIPALPYHVYFQHAGFFRVGSVEVHPDFNQSAEHDAAVLTLVEPVTGIRPSPLIRAPVEIGTTAVIAGFGRVGGDDFEYGIKRRGSVTTAPCLAEQGAGKLCWLHDGSAGSSESNVCHGDSGGATFVERDGVLEVAGVHSTTNQQSCLEAPATPTSADTAVFDHRAFLTARSADPAPLACGDVPHIGDAGAAITVETGSLELGESAEYVVEVPPGTAELRVAMNSSDGVDADLDLFVMAGATAGPGRFDCASDGTGPHAYCEIDSPAPGPWYVGLFTDSTGSSAGGQYQLTATLLTGAPVAHGDRYVATAEAALVMGRSAGLLLNDEESARPGLVAELDRPPRRGRVTVSPSGGFVYLPNLGHVGPDSFRYRASDGVYSGAAMVEIDVRPARTRPGIDGPPHGGCAAGRSNSAAGTAALLVLGLACAARRRRGGRAASISRSGLPSRR